MKGTANEVMQAMWREVARHRESIDAAPDLGSVTIIANLKGGRVTVALVRTESRAEVPRDPQGRIVAPTGASETT